MSSEQKNYAKGVFPREKIFKSGGSLLSVSIKTDDFCAWLRGITDDQGWARVNISPRREPSEKGITHTVYEDTWRPNQQQGHRAERNELTTDQRAVVSKAQSDLTAKQTDAAGEELPF